MRNAFFTASITLLAVISACQSEEQSIDRPESAPCRISCTMSATMPEFKAGGDPETKSSLESVVRVKWKKNDELSVINLTTGKQLGGCIKADKDGATTTFSPSDLSGSITAGDKLVFLLDSDPSRRSANEKDFEPFTMDFSSQKGNSNEVPIVVYAEYTATANGTINAVNPEFNFLMGYVQLAVSSLPASTSVTELGIENLNTKCHFGISNNAFVPTPQNGNLTLSEAFTANSKGTNTRYFSCFASPAQGTARCAHINANSLSHITAWLKAALSAGYYYQSVATGFTNENISFVDETFKSYCVSHYDKNGDGEVSFAEAAAVTSFENFTAAEKSSIKEVFELPYFFKGERIPNFEGCTALKQVILPGSLQNIQANAFKGCTGLEVITIPSTVTTIGEGAFEGCTSLARFDGAYASTDRRYIVRDNHVLAFAPAGLTEITIPDGVTTINAGVFANNTSLKTVNLPAQLTTVEARAFKGCTSLPIIRFRTQIASIGDEAFKGCSILRSVYTDAATPPTIGTDAFANCHASLAAHVTSGNLAAYEAAPAWVALHVTTGQPWNEIWYTTTDGEVCDYYYTGSPVSNTYVDGKGIMCFYNDLTQISKYAFANTATLETINLPSGVMTIGDYAFYYCTALTSVDLPISLQTIGSHAFSNCPFTSITLPDGLLSIGTDCFLLCTSLTSITVPSSVQTIESGAFGHCTSLTSITLPDGLQTINGSCFSDCSLLASISLPNSVQTIGNFAFNNCRSLASITLPDGLQSIEDYVFNSCNSLSSVTMPDSVQTIGDHAFSGCHFTSITLPDGLQSIGRYAFSDCSLLSSIIIPSSVQAIGNSAFYYCGSLTSITIPDGVQSIGEYTFDHCSSLTSITLPDCLQTIGNSAFSSCSSLTSIALSDDLQTIGNSAFYRCSSLTSITIPEGVQSIGVNTFNGCSSLTSVILPNGLQSIGNSAFSGCRLLSSITIPSSVQTIGNSAFYYCSSLTSITIPEGVQSIGDNTFDGCSLLASIILPEGLLSIGNSAFGSCNALTLITLPGTIESIGNTAFLYCYNLATIYIKAITPPNHGINIFSNPPAQMIIYVPTASVDAYKTAWSEYDDKITGYNFS